MDSNDPFNIDHYPSLLLPDEEILLARLEEKGICDFSEIAPPDDLEYLPIVRGGFVASLLKGELSDFSAPRSGIRIFWCSVIGGIDLRGEELHFPVRIENCYIGGKLDLAFSKIKNLELKGTFVEHLDISYIEASGSIVLSYGFKTPTPVWGMGAKINGQLGCSGGEFGGFPLAIKLEVAQIEGTFFWRFIKGLKGIVDLTSASVGLLVDDRESWPDDGNLHLAGFTYKSLGGNTNSSFYDRLEWLKRQAQEHLKEDFRSQPFEQLISVLQNSGRESEASRIAIQKNHYQRNANFLRRNPKLVDLKQQQNQERSIFRKAILQGLIDHERRWSLGNVSSFIKASWVWSASFIFWAIAGYGYRPLRCLFWSALIILIGNLCYYHQFAQGNIIFLDDAKAVNVGTNFYPLVFAADTYIPFLDLGQSSKWLLKEIPNQKFQPFLLLHWMFIFLGWFFAAIFGASVTGLVRK